MADKSSTIKKNITQFVLIVFSVVLGVYLSERIEERKKKQESENLLRTIKSEVKDNLLLLEDWYPYHEDIHENLVTLSQNPAFIEEFVNDKYIFFERLFTRGTFMSRTPASDAWDIAKSHPLIVNVDYDKYLIVSRIYSQQKMTYIDAPEMFDLLNSKDVNTKENAASNLEIMSNHIRELVAREKSLYNYYKEAEKILDLNIEREIKN